MKEPSSESGAAPTAAERLRALIVGGQLAPGTALVERALAERLGVGRPAARVALQLLEREGYVATEKAGKYSRSIVARLTLRDMLETHELMGALTGMAARRTASLKKPAREALADELQAMNRHLQLVAVQEPTNFSALYEADHRFHSHCLQVAASTRLLRLYEILAPQAERYGRIYATAVVGKGLVSAAEHQLIVDAIRRGDPDAAELTTVKNYLNAAQRFREVIESLGQGNE